MKFPLHILHLEDDPADADLIHSKLEAEGIPCATIRVQTRDAFTAALERGGIDLILSDFLAAGVRRNVGIGKSLERDGRLPR